MKSAEGETIGTVENVVGQTSDTRYDLLFTTTKVNAAIALHPSDLVRVYIKRSGFEQLVIGGAMRMQEV